MGRARWWSDRDGGGMSEPGPVYETDETASGFDPLSAPLPASLLRATPQTADRLRVYFSRRREALIMELRELDRFLGLPQTIPERRR